MVKNPSANSGNEMQVEDPLEAGVAIHSSIFTWRIPWTEEPGGLRSVESQRVRHYRAYALCNAMSSRVSGAFGGFSRNG